MGRKQAKSPEAEGKREHVSAEKFVKAWISSSCIREVTDKTGLCASSVHARAQLYRSLGVELPRMRGLRVRVDVEALNGLIRARQAGGKAA